MLLKMTLKTKNVFVRGFAKGFSVENLNAWESYFFRCRFTADSGASSDWSAELVVTTASEYTRRICNSVYVAKFGVRSVGTVRRTDVWPCFDSGKQWRRQEMR